MKENEKNFNNVNDDKLVVDNKLIVREKFETLNDLELSELDYEEALEKDKRSFTQLYLALIRRKNLLIFSFLYKKDYNSYLIKIFIFFFTFSMNLVVGAMFYSDETMHKIYVDFGKFDFISITKNDIIYSCIISTILENVLNILGLYEKDIIESKKNKEKKEKILSKIKIKIIIFFIIVYISLFFFWIYLGCFCAVYKNTQIHLLIDVLSSLCISFITPFFVVLLSCSFRLLSLKDDKKKKYYV